MKNISILLLEKDNLGFIFQPSMITRMLVGNLEPDLEYSTLKRLLDDKNINAKITKAKSSYNHCVDFIIKFNSQKDTMLYKLIYHEEYFNLELYNEFINLNKDYESFRKKDVKSG